MQTVIDLHPGESFGACLARLAAAGWRPGDRVEVLVRDGRYTAIRLTRLTARSE